MRQKLELFQNYITDSKDIVFLGGAGVSTESGIPDFRSSEGVYTKEINYPAETVLSRSFFFEHTKEFYRFYKKYMLYLNAKPNITHNKLTELEQSGKLKSIITQNIDGLHQKAGSLNVLELHGCILDNSCIECHKKYSVEFIYESSDMPTCTCGGVIKPGIVLYEEPLDPIVLEQAINAITDADMMIIGGTSLNVYPAAGLINYYKGNKLVIINQSPTLFDKQADLLLHTKLGDIMSQIDIK